MIFLNIGASKLLAFFVSNNLILQNLYIHLIRSEREKIYLALPFPENWSEKEIFETMENPTKSLAYVRDSVHYYIITQGAS